VSALQELADSKTLSINALTAIASNADAIAAKVAPLIKVPAGTPQLTEEQISTALRTVLADLVLAPRAE
jgi:predicted cation transporter